jgi:hypothetical protein
MTDNPRERLTLQQSILTVLDRRKREVPKGWYAATRKDLASGLASELKIDRA